MNQIANLKLQIKNMEVTEPKYLNYKQAAKHIGRSYDSMRQLVCQGKIPPYKPSPNGRVYLKVEDLDNYMAGITNDNKTK